MASSEVILTGRYHASRACGSAETTCIDPPKVEAFEYRELADATSRLENTFGDLTSVSRLWFSVEGEEAETLKSTEKSRRGGQAMFGDWRIDESLVDVFENQTGSTRFGKQEALKVVDFLLAKCDDNGVTRRERLEECVEAFHKATEGDLSVRLDKTMEQCDRRWNEAQGGAEVTKTGLAELEAKKNMYIETLVQVLKDREPTVLAEMKREREANTRKIIATSPGDPNEEGRLLFIRQLEETELESRLKARQQIFDIGSQGVQVKKEEMERAILDAAREKVYNLLQVVEKMQEQQTMQATSLHDEKQRAAAVRADIRTRLEKMMEEEGKSPLEVAKEKTERVAHMALSLSRGVTSEQGSALVTNVLHSFTAGASEIKTGSEVMASHDTGDIVEQTNKEEGAGKDNGANVNTVDIGLLDECDRFEHNNAHLRERLTNLKMKRIRNERDAEERGTEKISQLILLLEKKDTLEDKLEVVQKAFAERLANLEQIQPGLQHINKDPEEFVEIQESANIITVQGGGELVGNSKADMEAEIAILTRKITCLRRKLVFKYACTVMQGRFEEAELGPGNDPNPPLGPIAAISNDTGNTDICGLPPALQVRAALFKQKKAVQHEIALMLSEETELTKSIKEATGDIVDGTRAKGGVDGVEGGSRVGEENTDEGKELDNQRRKGEGVPGEETKIRSTAPAVVGHGERSARLRLWESRKRMVRRKLSILYALVERNEEASIKSDAGMSTVDKEALHGVLQGEEIVQEKATTVLKILHSPELKKAQAIWLRESKAKKNESKTKPKDISPPISNATTAGEDSKHKALMGSITKKTASDKIFSVTSRVRRGTPKSAIEKKNFQAGVDTVTGVKAARAEKVVKVAKKRAMKEEQDRKDEENNKCDQLFKMRTAKKKRIWDLSSRIKAACTAKTRSMSRVPQEGQQEMKHIGPKAKNVENAREKEIRPAEAVGAKDLMLKNLPFETRRHISNMKKLESALISRCNICLERIRKLLRGRGTVPGVASHIKDVHPTDPGNLKAPRKLTRTEREKEKHLYSLTPQLERWRARIVAMTEVLEEAQAQGVVVELNGEDSQKSNDKQAKMRKLSEATPGSPPSNLSSARVLPLLPMSNICLNRIPYDLNRPKTPSLDSGRGYFPHRDILRSPEDSMLRHPPRFADAFVGLTLGEELEKMATIKKVSADSPDKAGTSNTKHVFQGGLYPSSSAKLEVDSPNDNVGQPTSVTKASRPHTSPSSPSLHPSSSSPAERYFQQRPAKSTSSSSNQNTSGTEQNTSAKSRTQSRVPGALSPQRPLLIKYTLQQQPVRDSPRTRADLQHFIQAVAYGSSPKSDSALSPPLKVSEQNPQQREDEGKEESVQWQPSQPQEKEQHQPFKIRVLRPQPPLNCVRIRTISPPFGAVGVDDSLPRSDSTTLTPLKFFRQQHQSLDLSFTTQQLVTIPDRMGVITTRSSTGRRRRYPELRLPSQPSALPTVLSPQQRPITTGSVPNGFAYGMDTSQSEVGYSVMDIIEKQQRQPTRPSMGARRDVARFSVEPTLPPISRTVLSAPLPLSQQQQGQKQHYNQHRQLSDYSVWYDNVLSVGAEIKDRHEDNCPANFFQSTAFRQYHHPLIPQKASTMPPSLFPSLQLQFPLFVQGESILLPTSPCVGRWQRPSYFVSGSGVTTSRGDQQEILPPQQRDNTQLESLALAGVVPPLHSIASKEADGTDARPSLCGEVLNIVGLGVHPRSEPSAHIYDRNTAFVSSPQKEDRSQEITQAAKSWSGGAGSEFFMAGHDDFAVVGRDGLGKLIGSQPAKKDAIYDLEWRQEQARKPLPQSKNSTIGITPLPVLVKIGTPLNSLNNGSQTRSHQGAFASSFSAAPISTPSPVGGQSYPSGSSPYAESIHSGSTLCQYGIPMPVKVEAPFPPNKKRETRVGFPKPCQEQVEPPNSRLRTYSPTFEKKVATMVMTSLQPVRQMTAPLNTRPNRPRAPRATWRVLQPNNPRLVPDKRPLRMIGEKIGCKKSSLDQLRAAGRKCSQTSTPHPLCRKTVHTPFLGLLTTNRINRSSECIQRSVGKGSNSAKDEENGGRATDEVFAGEVCYIEPNRKHGSPLPTPGAWSPLTSERPQLSTEGMIADEESMHDFCDSILHRGDDRREDPDEKRENINFEECGGSIVDFLF